jgi:hypothetical protein
MADFTTPYQSGLTVYDLVFNSVDRTAWDGSAFVDPAGATWPTCADPMDDDGAGTYSGSMPAGLPTGTYLVQAYLQLGAAPADSDPLVGFSFLSWAGTGSSPPATTALFEKALVADMKLNSVITGIVAGRVFPGKLPQGASLPALVYDIGQKTHERNLDGPNGIARCRVLIHAMSRRAIDCKAVAEQLRYRFDGFQGLLGTVEIVESWLSDDPDDYVPNDDGSDSGTFSVPAAFLFRYRETIPAR